MTNRYDRWSLEEIYPKTDPSSQWLQALADAFEGVDKSRVDAYKYAMPDGKGGQYVHIELVPIDTQPPEVKGADYCLGIMSADWALVCADRIRDIINGVTPGEVLNYTVGLSGLIEAK